MKGAERDFRQALDMPSAKAEAWNGLSLIDLENGDLGSSLEKLNRAITFQPQESFYLNNRGYVHLLLGNLEQAEADINESIALNSGNAWAYRNKGWYYYLRGEIDDATRLLLQAWEMDPFVREVPRMLGDIYSRQGDVKEACEWYDKGGKAGDAKASAKYSQLCV